MTNKVNDRKIIVVGTQLHTLGWIRERERESERIDRMMMIHK